MNKIIESVILKVSEVTKRFDLESSLTRKNAPEASEKAISKNIKTIKILKRMAALIGQSLKIIFIK